MQHLIWPFINFITLVAIIVYFARQPAAGFIQQRHTTLRDELKRVRDMLQSARDRHEEFTAKLKAIDAETTALREQAQQDAQASKLRVLSDAQRASGNIISDARGAAEVLYAELKGSLYGEIGVKILERAEVLMRERLTGDDRVRIQKEFSRQLETSA